MSSQNNRAILVVLTVLSTVSLIPLAHAASLDNWDVDITLDDDGSAEWRVILNYEESITRDDYWIFGNVNDVKVTVDGQTVSCNIVKPDVGTSIICDRINGSLIVYSFRVANAVSQWGSFQQFRYTFPITRLSDRFSLKIALPLGSALVDSAKLSGTGFAPFEPAFGKQGSDGRRIFVTWELQNPKLGETINSLVIYEPLAQQAETQLVPIVIIVAVIAGTVTYMIYFRKKPEHLLPALMPAERTAMELVIKQRSIDQRDIVRSTGFSKAKVSRIVQTLIDRRLIEAVPKGRTREIKLAKQPTAQENLWSKIFGLKVKQNVEKMELNRAQALELVQTTLTPMIDWLDTVSDRLHRHKYGYSWNNSSYELDERFENPVPDMLVREVSKMLPATDARLKSYKEGTNKLDSVLKRMENCIIRNAAFASACKKFSVKYPEFGKNVIENLIRHVIDKDQVIRDEYAWHRIWNPNATTLLRLAETRQLKNLRQELQSATQSLTRVCSTFRHELDQVREHLRKEHHLLFRELRV